MTPIVNHYLSFFVPFIILAGLLVWQGIMHKAQCRRWEIERVNLMDRIMAKDYQEFVSGQSSQAFTAVGMKDADAGRTQEEIEGERLSSDRIPVN